MKKIISLLLTLLAISMQAININAFAGTATVPLNVIVHGSLLLTNANDDSSSGKDPTINVNLEVTPDLGQTEVTGEANFRIRSNHSRWRLTAQKTKSDTGDTGLTDNDITLAVSKNTGSKADPNAGTILSPFNRSTTISKIPTSRSINVVSGRRKTSKSKDPTNKYNYYQVNTKYGVSPDFFYAPGTFKTTITYNLVSP